LQAGGLRQMIWIDALLDVAGMHYFHLRSDFPFKDNVCGPMSFDQSAFQKEFPITATREAA
jgi:hypothetical protein